MVISSNSNNLVKMVMSLHHKKGRLEHKLYIAEGIHLVSEALKAEAPIRQFYWTQKINTHPEGKALLRMMLSLYEGIEVTEAVFAKLSETESPQGILALIEFPAESDFKQLDLKLGLIIDGLQDPGNVGTIIRTAWAAGLEGLFFTPGSADPYQGKVVRATMGGIFHQRIYRNLEPEEIAQTAIEKQIQIIAGFPEAKKVYFDCDFSIPTLFLVGNEGKGVSAEWDKYPIQKVHIPQPGNAESLNVSVSAGILVFEAIRQRLTITPAI